MKKYFTLLTVIVLCLSLCSCKSSDYKNAMAQYEAGEYQTARDAFVALGKYKDSEEMLMNCYENLAKIRNTGSWAKVNCVDEYNSPTDEWYLVMDVEGVYKRGTVTQEPFTASFVIEKGLPYLSVLKNGAEPILGTEKPEEAVVIKCKNEKGEEFSFLGALGFGEDRMLITGSFPTMNCFADAMELQFAVVFPSDLDATYYFTVNNDSLSENLVLSNAMAEMTQARYGWYYDLADQQLQAGKLDSAQTMFSQLGDYRDAKQKVNEIQTRMDEQLALRKKTAGGTIAAGNQHTAALLQDGTVIAVGYNGNGQCNTSSWADIVAIEAGSWNTYGIKSNGTVEAVGYNENGQCNVANWTDIVDVKASDWHTVGLKSDGTVVAVGDSEFYRRNGETSHVSEWRNIMAIAVTQYSTIGLREDGTLVMAGYAGYNSRVLEWTDIVAVAAGGEGVIAGLKSDGTVVSTYTKSVASWTDIVAISCGKDYVLGLKADGTVVASKDHGEKGQCDVSDWKDIVDISTGYWHSVGLKSDGSVVAVGYNDDGACNVGNWTGIMVPK